MSPSSGGILVSVEGPNGVGKTTLATALTARLGEIGVAAIQTCEPTRTRFGRFVRRVSEDTVGLALAALVAADRRYHSETVLWPAVNRGLVVVTDRYLESSLVLQQIDGVPLETIWALNRGTLLPAITVILKASEEMISRRLLKRSRHSRYERSGSTSKEIDLYERAAAHMAAVGVEVIRVSGDDGQPETHARAVADRVQSVRLHRIPARA